MQLAVLRRARFGRSSEKLDAQVEQLELLIGESKRAPPRRSRAPLSWSRRRTRPPRRLEDAQAFAPRAFARPSADGDDRPRSALRLPDLRRRQVRPDRRRRARGARIRSLALQARRACAPEDELPRLRDHRPGADADAADREGTAGAGAARPRRRLEVLRSPAAASSGRHLRPPGRCDRPLRHGGLGRPYRRTARTLDRADRAACSRRPRAARRRHAGSGARSRPGQDQDRPTMDGGARRAPVRVDGAAGRLLSLLARPQGRARACPARGCRGYLHADGYAGFAGLYEADPETGAPRPDRGRVLGACAAQDLRRACRDEIAGRARGARNDRAAVRHRSRHPRAKSRRAPAARRRRSAPILAELRAFLDATLAKISGKSARRRHPLRDVALDGADPLRRRRAARNDQQRRRARHQAARPRQQELSVRRFRRRRPPRRDHVHAHRNRADQRRRSRSLARRRHRPHRRSSDQSPRRAAPLEMDPRQLNPRPPENPRAAVRSRLLFIAQATNCRWQWLRASPR